MWKVPPVELLLRSAGACLLRVDILIGSDEVVDDLFHFAPGAAKREDGLVAQEP